jgi:hypothetical protein
MMTAAYRSVCVAFALFLAGSAAALAEPLPLPSSDYAIRGTMAGGINVFYRHSKGKMRMEMKSAEMPQPMVAYFDVKTRKGVMVMNMPGMPAMAIDASLDQEGGAAVARGSGRRIGSDRVAGEACDEWKVDGTTAEEKATEAVVCVTSDGITLRMVGNVQGKRQTILQITEVSRAPQDMKLLTPPANLKPMQIPAGMMPPRK